MVYTHVLQRGPSAFKAPRPHPLMAITLNQTLASTGRAAQCNVPNRQS
jgi:hypothetical protein